MLSGLAVAAAADAKAPAANGPAPITACGASLCVGGTPTRFVGVNAYELATQWGTNAGCGGRVDDLDGFFRSLPPNSLVRFWAFQDMATNYRTRAIDWGPLDRVVAAAARNNQRLVMTLANNWEACDGYAKDTAWYGQGYRETRVGTDGFARMAYSEWVMMIVRRYRSSSAVGMWEPVNEPEVACGSAPVLRRFFDAVGSQIHRLDREHLVSSGTIGGGQCGAQGSEYQDLHASRGIDVASYHDYGADSQPMPGDQWNGLAVRIQQSRALGKPIIVGEVGITASLNTPGCPTQEQRRVLMYRKARAQFAAGVSAFLPWDWVPAAQPTCTLDIGPNDPLLSALGGFAA